MDAALSDRPKKNGHELSAALRCLVAFRDSLITACRDQPDGVWNDPLERVNAIISSVLATQFPLGEIPWEEMEKARRWLTELLDRRSPGMMVSGPRP